MGCCPSKHKASKGSADLPTYDEYPPTEKIDIDFILSERATNAHVPDAVGDSKSHDAPSNMLMDRGDGCAIDRSDHGAIGIVIETGNQTDHDSSLCVRPAETTTHQLVDSTSTMLTDAIPTLDIAIHDTRGVLSVPAMAPSPARMSAPTSPSKSPVVNFDDIPINSMYHRIHTVEMEEQEARRRQELQEEAERREREIQEFKAAMLAGDEG
jgi:hypothetical protein